MLTQERRVTKQQGKSIKRIAREPGLARLQSLLHTQNEQGKTTQSGTYRPGETMMRRSVRHDTRRNFLYPAGGVICLTT